MDLDYRFFKEYWRKGFATEAAFASLKDGFEKLDLSEIITRDLPKKNRLDKRDEKTRNYLRKS